MAHRHLPAQFQQIETANHIGRDIHIGVFQRIAHPRLGGEMHHHLWPRRLHHRPQPGHIGHILHMVGEARPGQLRQPGMFQAHIIIGHQIIHAHDLMALGQQPPAEMKANKASAAGDQDPHGLSPKSHQMPVKASRPSRRMAGSACSSGPCCLQPL